MNQELSKPAISIENISKEGGTTNTLEVSDLIEKFNTGVYNCLSEIFEVKSLLERNLDNIASDTFSLKLPEKSCTNESFNNGILLNFKKLNKTLITISKTLEKIHQSSKSEIISEPEVTKIPLLKRIFHW